MCILVHPILPYRLTEDFLSIQLRHKRIISTTIFRLCLLKCFNHSSQWCLDVGLPSGLISENCRKWLPALNHCTVGQAGK